MRRWLAPVMVAGLCTATAACGVPVDSGPSAVSKSGVPFGLLAPSPPPSTATTQPSPIEVPVQIFLVGSSGHLVSVARTVSVAEPDLGSALTALVDGPTQSETAAGLQSALPAQTIVLGATISNGVATVDLGGPFGQLVGTQQIEAVAQVVFTSQALPGVTGVTFELSGAPVQVPTASGAEVTLASTAQFAPFAPTSPAKT